MRKFTSLFLLLTIFLGTVKGQVVNNLSELSNAKVYTIKSARENSYLLYYSGAANNLSSTISQGGHPTQFDKTNSIFHFAIYKHGSFYYFYNIAASKFVGSADGAIPLVDVPTNDVEIRKSGNNNFPFVFSTKREISAINIARTAGCHGVINWNGGYVYPNDDGNQFQIEVAGELPIETQNQIKTQIEKSNLVEVTYIYKLNNAEYQRATKLQNKNSAAAAPAQNFLRLGAYSKNNVGETDCEITVECTENLPFVASNSFAEAKWQVVEMHRWYGNRYWQYDAATKQIQVQYFNQNQVDNRADVPAENRLWCFVGNLKDGFVIYNMAAGETMTLSNKNTPVFEANVATPTKWQLSKSNAHSGSNVVCFKNPANNQHLNQQQGVVKYWGETDNGSTCFIDEAEQFIFSLGAKDWAEAHKVGAIGVKGHGTAEAKELVAKYEVVKNNSAFNLTELQALATSFKAVKNSSVAAEGPKAGYYFIYNTGVGDKNNSAWRLTYDGTNCKAKVVNQDQKLGAEHVWYLQPSGNGFKMQSCNVGKFLGDLAAAPAVTPIASDETAASVYTFTNDNGKFIIKDSKNKVLRTEDNGEVNEWNNNHGSELGEKWYLVEATDLELTIGNGGYSTVHFPFDVTLPAGVSAYAIENVDNTKSTVALVNKTEVPANKGAILQGVASQAYTLTITPKDAAAVAAVSDWSKNLLQGSNVKTLIEGQAYILANPKTGNGVGLYKTLLNKNAQGEAVQNGGTHFHNNANRAYLPIKQGPAAVQFYGFEFNEDGTTGIENIEDAIINNGNAVIFDLSGRRVQNTTKGGIYIVNGKKVVR